MRILFINQFFYPDASATSQLLTDLAVDLAAAGHEVSVLTGNALYQASPEPLRARESYKGVTIRRIYCGRFDRESGLRRAISYGRFLFGAGVRLFRRRRLDVILVLTTPPMIAMLPALLCTWRGTPFVCWVQDVYPDIAHALGVVKKNSRAARLAQGLMGYIFASAAGIVVLGDCMRELVLQKGSAPQKLSVIHNWAADNIVPVPRSKNPFLRGLGIRDEFVACYSGNLGLGHEFETLFGAMLRLRAHRQIRFLIIGEGARLRELREQCYQAQLDRVTFLPSQPRGNLSHSLSAGDVGLVSMRQGCEGTMVASKIYGLLAAGRPYIYIGPAATTMAAVAAEWQCGWQIDNGADARLAAWLEHLQAHPDQVAEAGRNARLAYERSFTRARAVREFELVLARAAGHPSGILLEPEVVGSAVTSRARAAVAE